MPKVISRGTTVSSGNETQFTDENIFVYYCVCGTLCLTIDTPLEKLPRRKTDNAHIIQAGKREYRFKTKPLEPVTFKRDKGYEKQFRAGCEECGLPVCYTPKEKSSPITYVLAGALRLQQYGLTTDPLPLEEIKELPGVEYDEYVAEQRKEKLREEEEEGDAATRAPLRLSDLPRQEQERQIREKLKALERGDDTRLSSLASSSSSTAPSQPAAAPSEERDRERKRSRERESTGDREEAEGKERQTRRSRSPEEKRRRRSRSNSRERDYHDSGRH